MSGFGWGEAAAAGTSIGMGTFDTIIRKNQSDWNRRATKEQNEADRAFQEFMYNKSRSDALDDYHMQNRYNSPEEIMNRLRQAGLNPNLIYGKGAEMTAASVKQANASGGSQPAPQHSWEPGLQDIATNAISAYQNVKLTQAQTDNINQQTALASANTLKSLTEGKKVHLDLYQANRMKDMIVQEMELRNKKASADLDYTIDENRRKELANTRNVQKTLIDIERGKAETQLTRENIKLLQNTARVRQVEAELAEAGIMPSDQSYYKLFMKLLHEGKKALDHLRDKK